MTTDTEDNEVDSDGFSLALMEGIIDYKCDDSIAIPKADRYITTGRGQRRLWKTTAGWKLLVKWKDQSESWVKLSELKESHPVDTVEFAKSRGIDDETTFAWWVPHTLRKRNAIISAMKTRLQKTTHKYGIEIPTSVDHAMEVNRKNGNTMWRDALALEMFNVGVAFEILEEGQTAPIGWEKASRDLFWDVKMDFTRKARWVLDGAQSARPNRVHFRWCGLMQECPNSLYVCCAKWPTSVRGRHTQCIPSSTIFLEGLCCVWPRIRNRKHWEGGTDSLSIIWRQKCRPRL